MKTKFDKATAEWFKKQPPWMETTVQQCEACGLWYKPELGHKCEKEEAGDERTE